jgi:hypothetical protein
MWVLLARCRARSYQTIVLSPDKGFLRLLWDKIDQKLIKAFALQRGPPGVTTITPYYIPGSTQLRHVTERMKIGLVTVTFRSINSVKRPFVRMPTDFSHLTTSAVAVDYKTH